MSGSQSQQFHNADPFASLRGFSASTQQPGKVKIAPPSPQTVRARKTRRSPELVQAIHGLDSQINPIEMVRWLRWINENYTLSDCGLLLGLFSHCYLGVRPFDGQPFLDHRLDLTQEIIEHYTGVDSVPTGFEVARPLARNEAYAYIEVYTDGTVIPIYPDGRPG